MSYKTEVKIPRTTYNGLCAFLQQWSDIYRQPGASVLTGSIREPYSDLGKKILADPVASAPILTERYGATLRVLGRAKVTKNEVFLDLRDLEEEEAETLYFVVSIAPLRGAQRRALDRLALESRAFLNLPAMVRIALAAK